MDDYEGVTHAGIAVVAADSGLILFAQRAFDETDAPDVAERWEFPGGAVEPGEDPQAAAYREFAEEMGAEVPTDVLVVDGWRSSNGVYQLFVALVPAEFAIPGVPTAEVQDARWMTPDQAMQAGLRPEMADFDWSILDSTDLPTDDVVSGNESNMDKITPDDSEYDAIAVGPIPVHGVVAPENVETGDKRGFEGGAMSRRPGRLPFRWADRDMGAHDGAFTIGSVDRMMRKGGLIPWSGLLLPEDENVDKFVNMLAFFGRFGVSVDGDKGTLNMEKSLATGVAWFDAVRAAGLTAVDIPAFHEAYVAFGPHPDMPEEESEIEALTASGDFVAFGRGPGWATNPRETSTIHRYWTEKGQEGYAKVAWGTRGDFTRAKALIGAKIAKNAPEKMKYLNQIIAQWHFDALGYWPGDLDKPGNKTTAEAKAERVGLALAPEVTQTTEQAEDGTWEAVLVASIATGLKSKIKGGDVQGFKTKRPPLSYFQRHPNTGPLVIEDPDEMGFRRVHGYAAERGVCHIGYGNKCVEPPIDETGEYKDFHLGRTRLEKGSIPTGLLTYKVEHRDAKKILAESPTQAHFDDLSNAWASVRLGTDENGIWFSGVVLPKVDADDVTLIEASGQISGEWKYGALRALLSVNVPGYPVEQTSAEFDADGNLVALVASAFGQATGGDCQPTPAERMAALRMIEAEEGESPVLTAAARIAALKEAR